MIGCLCIHGGELGRLKGVTYQDWVREAEQALQGMLTKCGTVYLVASPWVGSFRAS
ncbi:MAG TPA: hypothetical protein GXX18_14595 [Bacillales bacterium]|nr:hypothetical protein [Bacillales bacterium]